MAELEKGELRTLALDAPTRVLDGVGPAREKALERAGIECLRDLLWLRPVRIREWGARLPLREVEAHLGQRVVVAGERPGGRTRRIVVPVLEP